jgi:hypothetical protein
VSWHFNKWRASIKFQGRTRYLGRFDTEEAAAKAYDEEAKRLWTNPILNFLPDGSINPHRKRRAGRNALTPHDRPQTTHRHGHNHPSPSGAAAATAAAAASSSATRAPSSSTSKPNHHRRRRRRLRACVDSIYALLDSSGSEDEHQQAAAAAAAGSHGSGGVGLGAAAGADMVEALQAYAARRFVELEEGGEEEEGAYGRALGLIFHVRVD